jgi:predicted MPP superfamily phosphohydrolase
LSAVKYGGRGPDLTKTLAATTERPKILLAHQPRQFDEAAGKVALQLSGHTHGLQFDFLARAGRIAHRYVSGAYEKDGSLLWVNRGFGVTGPPSRVGVRPEVTKIVLVSA